MTPTRRNLFKIAAGLGLTGIAPTIAQRIAAHEALHTPVSDRIVHDPAQFAEEAHLLIGLHGELTNDWIAAICPEAYATFAKAQRQLEVRFPHIGPNATPEENAFHEYDEAAFALALAFYDAGVKHGAAFEHLRRSVIGELAACLPCQGVGVLRSGETCSECGGAGTVAVRGEHRRG